MNRILVIALSGIGDTLIATPLLRQLRADHPSARIEALVLWPGAASLLEHNPHLDAVHQHPFLTASRMESLRFVAGLRRRRFDVSINIHTQGRREYRWIARMIGARRRLSHEYENQSWLDRCLVTDSLPQDYTVHGAINNQRLLALLGPTSPDSNPRYELYLNGEEQRWASNYAAAHEFTPEHTLGIHAGSGGTKNLALRRWPADHYLELTRRLLAEMPQLRIAYFGGPDEAALHARIARKVDSNRVFFPVTPTVRHAAALLGHLGAFLSVDTLFMHLAAAMRVPHQVVIETPTMNPPILPLRKDWTLIPNPGVGGRNLDFYRYDGRPIAGTPEELGRIMASVSVDAVFQVLRSRLARDPDVSRPNG